MVFLVLADSPCYCGRELKSRESLAMDARVSRDGRRLHSKCGSVRANALLHHRANVSSCSRFRRALCIWVSDAISDNGAASQSVPSRRLRCLLPRTLRRDSSGRVDVGDLVHRETEPSSLLKRLGLAN